MNKALNSSNMHEWQTPREVLDLVRAALGGPITLDPATSADNPTEASEFFTEREDGLASPWGGDNGRGQRVFLNPPYGRALPKWSARAAAERSSVTGGIILTPARTDTRWFRLLWDLWADSACFWGGRMRFVDPRIGRQTDPAPFPCVLWYRGAERRRFHSVFKARGVLVDCRPGRTEAEARARYEPAIDEGGPA